MKSFSATFSGIGVVLLTLLAVTLLSRQWAAGGVPVGASEDSSTASVPSAALACKQSTSGDIDAVGPRDEADAEGWPHSEEEAAEKALTAPALFPPEEIGHLTLRPQTSPSVYTKELASSSEEDSAAPVATFDVVNDAGDVVGRIGVRDFGFGAYAVQQVERCIA